MIEKDLPRPHVARGIRRWAYALLGCVFVALAVLGVILPILPTTPFVLLASYFFVRSSPALHVWLLRSRWFGGLLHDWQRHRGVRPRVKATAVVLIPLMIAGSAVFGNLSLPFLIVLVVLGLIGTVVVLRLPLVRDEQAEFALEPLAAPCANEELLK